MKWIALAALISLFAFFPKKMFGGLGVLVLIGSAVGGYFYYQEWSDKKVKEAVKVTIEYSPAYCEELTPLKVTVDNTSDKTITMVEWDIAVHQSGFSTDLAEPGYQIYSQDKILRPEENRVICVGLPVLKREIMNISELVFSAANKDVIFE